MVDMGLNKVYEEREYSIYASKDGYILVNENMQGFAHTHINRLETALWLISLSKRKKLPHDISRYLLISLLRVNADDYYLKKITELMENKRKKSRYANRAYGAHN